MKALLTVFAMLAAASTTAHASEEPKKKEEGSQSVTLSPVAVPIVVNGKVVNYVFLSLRVDLTPSANASKLREREPYFRDALIRAAHRTPFTLPGDYTKIDEARLKASLMRDAAALAGPGNVRGVSILSQAPKSQRVAAR